MTGEAPRGQRIPRACIKPAYGHTHSWTLRTLALALSPVGNSRSDMQIATVTTNARLTVTLLTDRYTESGERVHACASERPYTEDRIHVRMLIAIDIREKVV